MTAEYFRRDKNAPKGFQVRCKPCSGAAIKAHYRSWKSMDIDERGETGARCILHSPACGVCPVESVNDVGDCWRLGGMEFGEEEYPVELEQ